MDYELILTETRGRVGLMSKIEKPQASLHLHTVCILFKPITLNSFNYQQQHLDHCGSTYLNKPI